MSPTPSPSRCDGRSRRDFLHLGVLAPLGLSLAGLLRLQAAPSPSPTAFPARARSCILIWLDGGPSHLDTFDPKPDAPVEVRSPFQTIPTTLAGVRFCEHLPRIARQMREIALIRSLTHELGNHDTGSRFLLTGHRPNPALEYPSLGSVVAEAHGLGGAMPPYVAVPHDSVGGDSSAARAGYLPGAYGPFNVGLEPERGAGFQPPEGVSFDRSERRRDLLQTLDGFSRQVEDGPVSRDRDAFYAQAYRLLASSEAQAAFDLNREPTRTRERYGAGRLGRGCLLARRLVEGGARFVTVVDPGWDTHQQISRELPDSRFPGSGKLPALDRAYSALLEDLRVRGLLDSTLVVLMGEFGRTPKLNALGGRDHWPRAGSVLLAGGGVQGGQVIGATNSFGELPVERPISPPDLACSLLTLLGVDPTRDRTGPGGRPLKVLSEGRFIQELV